jgi:hypothetical protein
MEATARKTPGVADATVNFMTQKLIVEFAEGADVRAKLAELWPKPWSDEHEALCKLIGC